MHVIFMFLPSFYIVVGPIEIHSYKQSVNNYALPNFQIRILSI